MANQKTKVYTIQINGVEKSIESIEDLIQVQKELNISYEELSKILDQPIAAEAVNQMNDLNAAVQNVQASIETVNETAADIDKAFDDEPIKKFSKSTEEANKSTEELKQSLEQVGERVSEAAFGPLAIALKVILNLVPSLQSAFSKFFSFIFNGLGNITTAFTNLFTKEGFKKFFNSGVDAAKSFFGILKDGFTNVVNFVKTTGPSIAKAFSLEGIKKTVTDLKNGFLNLGNTIKAVGVTLKTAFSLNATIAALTAVVVVVNEVIDAFGGLGNTFDFLKVALESLKSGFRVFVDEILPALEANIQIVLTPIRFLISTLQDLVAILKGDFSFKNVKQSVETTKQAFRTLGNAVENVNEGFKKGAEFGLFKQQMEKRSAIIKRQIAELQALKEQTDTLASDENNTFATRNNLLQRSFNLEQQIAAKKIELANNDLAVFQKNIELKKLDINNLSVEDTKALEEKKTAVVEANNFLLNSQLKFNIASKQLADQNKRDLTDLAATNRQELIDANQEVLDNELSSFEERKLAIKTINVLNKQNIEDRLNDLADIEAREKSLTTAQLKERKDLNNQLRSLDRQKAKDDKDNIQKKLDADKEEADIKIAQLGREIELNDTLAEIAQQNSDRTLNLLDKEIALRDEEISRSLSIAQIQRLNNDQLKLYQDKINQLKASEEDRIKKETDNFNIRISQNQIETKALEDRITTQRLSGIAVSKQDEDRLKALKEGQKTLKTVYDNTIKTIQNQTKDATKEIEKNVKDTTKNNKTIITNTFSTFLDNPILFKAKQALRDVFNLSDAEVEFAIKQFEKISQSISNTVTSIFDAQKSRNEAQQFILQQQLERINQQIDESTKRLELLNEQLKTTEDNIKTLEDALKEARGGRELFILSLLTREREERDKIADAVKKESDNKKRLEASKLEAEKRAQKLQKEGQKIQLESNKLTAQGTLLTQAQAAANAILAITDAEAGVAAQAKLPFPLNVIAIGATIASLVAGIAGVVSSISQINDINSKIDAIQFADGGLLNGPSHSKGGIKGSGRFSNIEVEGGEYIVNKYSTAQYLPILESINNKKYADGGLLPTAVSFNTEELTSSLKEAISGITVVTSIESIDRVKNNSNNIINQATI